MHGEVFSMRRTGFKSEENGKLVKRKMAKRKFQKPMAGKVLVNYPIIVSLKVERYFYIPRILFNFLIRILLRLLRAYNSKINYKLF